MKQLTTNITGGQPIRQDDLGLIQDNVKELTANIAKGLSLGETAFILTGCEITVNGSGGATPTLDLTAGSIYYLDEIYLVDVVSGQSLPNGTTQANVEDNYEWDLDETFITTVSFKDASSHEIHQYRKSILVLTPSTWTGLNALKNIPELFKTQIIDDLVFTDQSPSGEYAVSGYSGKYMKDESFRSLDFELNVLNASPSTHPTSLIISANEVFLIPNGAYYPVKGLYNSVLEDMYIKVTSATPTRFEIFRSNGSDFANASTVTIWYNGVNHL